MKPWKMPNSIVPPPQPLPALTVAALRRHRQVRPRVHAGLTGKPGEPAHFGLCFAAVRSTAMLHGAVSIALLIVVGLTALGNDAAALLGPPAVAAPPLSPGLARVWFLRQFEPSEGLR